MFPDDDLDIVILTNQPFKATSLVDIAGTVFETILPPSPVVDPDLPAAGQPPKVTERFTQLLNDFVEGRVDLNQLSPGLRAKVSPELLQSFSAKFKGLGKPSKVVFKKQLNGEQDIIYVYRVDFEKEPSNFVLQINKESDLVDCFFPPIWLGH